MRLNPTLAIFFDREETYCVSSHGKKTKITDSELTEIEELRKGKPIYELDPEVLNLFIHRGIVDTSNDAVKNWDIGPEAKIFHDFSKTKHFKNIKSREEQAIGYIYDSISKTEKDISIRTKINGVKIPLPHYIKSEDIFEESLYKRKTERSYKDEPLELTELSEILYLSLGEIHGDWKELEARGLKKIARRRSSPAGGGLHSIEGYIVVKNVSGLDNGIYFYDGQTHELVYISAIRNEATALSDCLHHQLWSDDLCVGIFLVSKISRIWQKYTSPKAYRVPFLDAGHISQTIQLSATYKGVSTWPSGAFFDDYVSELLALKEDEIPTFFVGLAKGTGDFLSKEQAKLIDGNNDNNKLIL
ncbi:hypothetical protein BK412_07695 [Vibrio campbellii]|uniref:SagB/ThcOx family dehydrogenase n=1 Tax=Vibrio campbellii TaxID=680 RepID=UPI0009BE8ACE|nr:SagB/ThcOx family dehydrogenase [Vibrio campbellii]OQQ04860.1 hypothetical protein BK412_07695 [Vibrio campbellii]